MNVDIKLLTPDELSAMLKERKGTHGHFIDHARITQALKQIIHEELNRCGIHKFSPCHVESLEMIVHKIGRIIAGDPTFADHWDDIAGYAKIANYRVPE